MQDMPHNSGGRDHPVAAAAPAPLEAKPVDDVDEHLLSRRKTGDAVQTGDEVANERSKVAAVPVALHTGTTAGTEAGSGGKRKSSAAREAAASASGGEEEDEEVVKQQEELEGEEGVGTEAASEETPISTTASILASAVAEAEEEKGEEDELTTETEAASGGKRTLTAARAAGEDGELEEEEATAGTEAISGETLTSPAARAAATAAAAAGEERGEDEEEKENETGEEDGDEEEETDDDDDEIEWGAAKHIFVLSSAGKPVFSLSGDEQRLSTLMSLIQALLSLCADCDSGDEIESISAGSRRFVFLKRGNLVLVAVSSSETVVPGRDREEQEAGEKEAPECESFMRLQLEYLYASIIFLLTSKVQDIFLRSPGYDLRGLLGGADTSLRGIIELAEPSRGSGRMLASGVETVWMDPAIRTRVAGALQAAQTASATSGALYAIWVCGEKLVSLAQPRAPSHRLTSRDLLLLVNFVATQPALRNAESWTPVCFPRFQETGYLYAYIAFLDDPSQSPPAPSPQPPPPPSPANDDQSHLPTDASKVGQGASESDGSRVGGGGSQSASDGNVTNGKTSSRTGEGNVGVEGGSCIILVSVESSSEQFEAFRRTRAALESRFRSALGTHWDRYLGSGAVIERKGILTKFCTQMQALHFYYCLRGRQGGAPCVTQCLSSPFTDPELADDPAAQRRIWGLYARAALRLRRGSCQEGRVFCGRGAGGGGIGGGGGGQRSAEIRGGGGGRGGGRGGGGGERRWGGARNDKAEEDLATALFESDPVHSLAYEIGDKVTVMSLFGQREEGPGGGGRWTSSSSAGSWGDRDELHACFPSSVAPEAAYKAAVRLTAIVRRDWEWLFVTGTGSAK